MVGVISVHVPDLICTWLNIYMSPFHTDAIDTGSNKSAIVACNKLLKKQPQNDLVKVSAFAMRRLTVPVMVARRP